MSAYPVLLRRLRKRYIGKQISLATSLHCSEAAVSHWERGKRLPIMTAHARILQDLQNAGAELAELRELRTAYEAAAAPQGDSACTSCERVAFSAPLLAVPART
jgi:transcriptional regulator with XRE-family HTH domain